MIYSKTVLPDGCHSLELAGRGNPCWQNRFQNSLWDTDTSKLIGREAGQPKDRRSLESSGGGVDLLVGGKP